MKKEARREAIKAFREKARKKMGEGRKGIAAQVVAKDKESLKEGLKKAAEVVDEADEMEEMAHEAMESEEHEMMEDESEKDYESMSKEELIKLLKKS